MNHLDLCDSIGIHQARIGWILRAHWRLLDPARGWRSADIAKAAEEYLRKTEGRTPAPNHNENVRQGLQRFTPGAPQYDPRNPGIFRNAMYRTGRKLDSRWFLNEDYRLANIPILREMSDLHDIRSSIVAADVPTSLYAMLNEADEWLYVGVSVDALDRYMQHAKSQPWISEVRQFKILSTYPSRQAALEAESMTITIRQPRYNKIWNNHGGHEQITAQLAMLRSLNQIGAI